METPAMLIERERERERVDSSPRFPRRHKILFGLVVTIGIIIYAAFNVWVYQNATNSKGSSSPAAIRQTVPSPGASFNGLKGDSPTPTPRPTGPGSYACSPEGTCNVYNDETRKQYCTMTYADNRCLDQCGTKENQCKK